MAPSNREKTTLSFTEDDVEFLSQTIRLAEANPDLLKDIAHQRWLSHFKARVGEARIRVQEKTAEYKRWRKNMDEWRKQQEEGGTYP